MKKFVILESIGNWEKKDGKLLISCTVEETRVYAESDNRMELWESGKNDFSPIEYREDGHWYSYSIRKRAEAKRLLK